MEYAACVAKIMDWIIVGRLFNWVEYVNSVKDVDCVNDRFLVWLMQAQHIGCRIANLTTHPKPIINKPQFSLCQKGNKVHSRCFEI